MQDGHHRLASKLLAHDSLQFKSPAVRNTVSRYGSRLANPSRTISAASMMSTDEASSLDVVAARTQTFRVPAQVNTSARPLASQMFLTRVVDESPTDFFNDSTLFDGFLQSIRQFTTLNEIFDLCESYEVRAGEFLSTLVDQHASKEGRHASKTIETLIKQERNSWRLIHRLTRDRFLVEDEGISEPFSVESLPFTAGLTDAKIIEECFDREHSIRQMQIIVDWLEQNAADDQALYNTLSKLNTCSLGILITNFLYVY